MYLQHHRARGFTLIELLIVIAIIGILSSVVLAATATARINAYNNQTTQEVSQYIKALDFYRIDHNDTALSTLIGTGVAYCCLGPDNHCWKSGNAYPYPLCPALTTGLSSYLPTLPLTNPVSTHASGGFTTVTSAFYQCDPMDLYNCRITMYLIGNVPCPFSYPGTARFYSNSSKSTLCILRIYE